MNVRDVEVIANAADLAAAADQTVPRLLHRNASEHGDHAAITSDTATLTWAQLRERAAEFSEGLVALGLEPGDRLLIMMSARPEHWIADHAAQHARAVPCTAYDTLSPEQIAFVAGHSRAPVVVLEGQHQIERWAPALADVKTIKHVIVVEETGQYLSFDAVRAMGRQRLAADPEAFERRWRLINPDDPVGMVYTSGTAGEPKGVVLTHRNVLYQAAAVDSITPGDDFPEAISYLPLAHIAERELGIYCAVLRTAHIHLCPDPRQVIAALARVHPSSFFGVPRVWEKVAAGVQGLLSSADTERRQAFEHAHALALQAFDLEANGKPVPDELAAAVAAADQRALAPVRALLGLDRVTYATSGAAPISVQTLRFLNGLGIPLREIWGMSETSGLVTACTLETNRVGSVGRAMAGMDVRLGSDGEVFVRGPIVLAGYLQPDGSVVSPVDADGWLATGDVGTLDEDGFLTITGRKKELIITSGGKNIAPTLIESHLTTHPAVGFATAIGDRRPFITALIVFDPDVISPQDSHSPQARSAAEEAIAAANAKLSRAEQVKRYTIVPGPWTPDTGEVTPKLSLRRRVIVERYAAQIDEMYGETVIS